MKVKPTRHAKQEISRLSRETGNRVKFPRFLNTNGISEDFVCLVYKLDKVYHLSDGSVGNTVVMVVDNKRRDRTFGNMVTVYLAHDYQVIARAKQGGHNGYSNYYTQVS